MQTIDVCRRGNRIQEFEGQEVVVVVVIVVVVVVSVRVYRALNDLTNSKVCCNVGLWD